MNVLVTLDRNYIGPLRVMLRSLADSNPDERFDLYIAHAGLTAEELASIGAFPESVRFTFFPIRLEAGAFGGAVVTDRYPIEMYFRIFAAQYLPPALTRILYLDPDVIVKGPVRGLYDIDFGPALFAGATHIRKPLQILNELRLGVQDTEIYVNSGVLMLNLTRLRNELDTETALRTINECQRPLLLPDQDILTILCGDRIKAVSALRYNLSDRIFRMYQRSPLPEERIDLDWVEKNTSILHFCGRNKPWNPDYAGPLGFYYDKYLTE